MTTGSRKGFALIVATFIVVFGFAGRADAAGVAYSDPAVTGSGTSGSGRSRDGCSART